MQHSDVLSACRCVAVSLYAYGSHCWNQDYYENDYIKQRGLSLLFLFTLVIINVKSVVLYVADVWRIISNIEIVESKYTLQYTYL